MATLLERFYEPQEGVIKLDSHNLAELDPSWLRGEVLGYISQEPVLFGCSVLENIRYGRPSATDQEVIAAAELAYADQFIREFPNGYDTPVGRGAWHCQEDRNKGMCLIGYGVYVMWVCGEGLKVGM